MRATYALAPKYFITAAWLMKTPTAGDENAGTAKQHMLPRTLASLNA